ncbi:MAG: primase-helicase family protein [Methylocella sp.]
MSPPTPMLRSTPIISAPPPRAILEPAKPLKVRADVAEKATRAPVHPASAPASLQRADEPADLTPEQRKDFKELANTYLQQGHAGRLAWAFQAGLPELEAVASRGATPSQDLCARIGYALVTDCLPPAPDIDDAEVQVTFGKSKTDNSAASRKTLSPTALLELVTRHREGLKDGPCVIPATFRGPTRAKSAAERIDIMMLDLDTGALPIDEIEKRLRGLGLAAAIASTYSHMTTEYKAKKADWSKFLAGHPGEGAPEFLRLLGYASAVCAGATVVRIDDGEEGFVHFRHGPCAKFRVTLLLARPWLAADYKTEGKPDQNKANEAWEALYRNTAAALGFEFDRSCIDPSHLFFLPRHPPGGPKPVSRIIHGRTLDPWALPDATKPIAAPEQARGKGTRRDALWSDKETGEVIDLVKWAAEFGPRFKIVDALRSRVPDVFVEHVSEGKHHIECPFSDEHSDNEPGTATFAANAGGTKTKGFVVSCLHSHCKKRERTDVVRRMLDDGWLYAEDLTDPKFLLPALVLDDVDRAVERLNRDHALVELGSNLRVLRETSGRDGVFKVAYLKIPDFRTKFANDTVLVGGKPTCVADLWLRHPSRRAYEEIVFSPGEEREGAFNLWRGFPIEPDPNASCELFLAHLKDNICRGDETLFNWLVGFFAHIVQKPWEKPDVVPVFQGAKGTGKSIVGEIIGALMPAYRVKVSTPDHLTGRFNVHLDKALLVLVEEAFWAGDKRAESALKDLITAETVRIEPKGVDSFEVKSCARMLMTSNSDWVVPATPGERRFAVFDVADARKQDHGYFAAMIAERDAGGLRALMHHLRTFDLNSVNVRQAPKTDANRDQILLGLESYQAWWRECLERGRIDHLGKWPVAQVKQDLFDTYRRYTKNEHLSYAAKPDAFWKALKRMAPGAETGRQSHGSRLWTLRLGSLDERRAEFDKFIGHKLDWPDIQPDDQIL